MRDLVVCVGDSCHLSGAELVVKSFQECIAQNQLASKVALKGSFCIGECCENSQVSVRFGDRIFQVAPEASREIFEREVLSALPTSEED
jgi:NADH:ubiquinone oxidoreductase subunit E